MVLAFDSTGKIDVSQSLARIVAIAYAAQNIREFFVSKHACRLELINYRRWTRKHARLVVWIIRNYLPFHRNLAAGKAFDFSVLWTTDK